MAAELDPEFEQRGAANSWKRCQEGAVEVYARVAVVASVIVLCGCVMEIETEFSRPFYLLSKVSFQQGTIPTTDVDHVYELLNQVTQNEKC